MYGELGKSLCGTHSVPYGNEPLPNNPGGIDW